MEDIKSVNLGNESALTISIGVGVDGASYSQNYDFARVSIGLALGRGGDQAIVKSPLHFLTTEVKVRHLKKVLVSRRVSKRRRLKKLCPQRLCNHNGS